MRLSFLLIVYLIIYVTPSSQSKRKNEDSLDCKFPLPTKAEIYRNEKNSILNRVREKRSPLGYNPEFDDLLRNLGIIELLRAMIADDISDDFLIIFWLGVRKRYNHRFFFKARSKTIPSSRNSTIRKVLENFKAFLFETFIESKQFSFVDSIDSAKKHFLLEIFRFFWHNRLENLGKKYLSRDEFVNQKRSFDERIRFLSAFIDSGSQNMLIREYKRLLHVINRQKLVISSPIFKNFRFLVNHFGRVMKDIELGEFVEKLEWLAAQNPIFLIYFFYFSVLGENLWIFQVDILNNQNFQPMQNSVHSQICWRHGMLIIFGRTLNKNEISCYDKFDRIVWLAKLIIRKTDGWI